MGASVTFITNQRGVDHLLHDPNGPYGRWLARLGMRMQNSARAKANVDTGLMRSRVEFRIETDAGKLVGILAAKTNYAVWVHRKHNPFLADAVRENL